MPAVDTLKRLAGALRNAPETRLSPSGMPDGFLFNDVVWFGDGGTRKVAVSRGITVEPDQLDNLDESFKAHVCDRLRRLISSQGNEYTLQVRYRSGSDYSDILDAYKASTDAIRDKHRFRWHVYNRTERWARYTKAMREGKLRRETLTLFFCRVIDVSTSFSLSGDALARHVSSMAKREALAFEQIQYANVRTLFPDCYVRLMGDREHFLHYYRFFNPNVGATVPAGVWEGFEPSFSIQENCLFGDLVQPPVPGVSFNLDGLHHALLVLRELPRSLSPGDATRLLGLGFSDFELTLNVYPKTTQKEIEKLGRLQERLHGESVTNTKRGTSFRTQEEMADEQVHDLEKGKVNPINLFLCLRLWHKDTEELVSRAAVARNAFTNFSGAQTYLATNPETARKLFYQTCPGWTHGTYRGYDLPTDDAAVSELIPWSAAFTGRLKGAEALYDSPKGSLVGLSTQVNGTGQHLLLAGATGAGKSILVTDTLAQIAPFFDRIIIVEEGLSHGTSVQTMGARPLILSPNGSVTLNYMDPDGMPLTTGFLAGAVGLCLQMLGELGGNPVRVSELQGLLSRHVSALYDSTWQQWRACNPQKAYEVVRHACAVDRYLHTRMRPQDGDGPLDAWVELRDHKDEPDIQAFMAGITDGDVRAFHVPAMETFIRDIGFSFLTPAEMPQHRQLVDLLSYTPLGSQEERREIEKIGQRLAAWKRDGGTHGCLFDGVSTHRLDAPVTLFELGRIPKDQEDLKAAAHHLILNVSRQCIIGSPRAERKLVIFEEGARILASAQGGDILEEYYTQLRKYGAVVMLILQQIAKLKNSAPSVRAAVMDNARLFLISAQPSASAVREVAEALDLSDAMRQTIQEFPSAEDQVGEVRYSSFLMVAPQSVRRLVGTFLNIATKAVVYCGKSDGKTFDERSKALSKYDDLVEGIIAESEKMP